MALQYPLERVKPAVQLLHVNELVQVWQLEGQGSQLKEEREAKYPSVQVSTQLLDCCSKGETQLVYGRAQILRLSSVR